MQPVGSSTVPQGSAQLLTCRLYTRTNSAAAWDLAFACACPSCCSKVTPGGTSRPPSAAAGASLPPPSWASVGLLPPMLTTRSWKALQRQAGER